MSIGNHPSFSRPPAESLLWRYIDLSKFVDLLTSAKLWLANAEVLAKDDPYEGLPGAFQFPHRMWSSIEDVPEQLRTQIIGTYGRGEVAPEIAFRHWFSISEQQCIMGQFGRRDYFANCWHLSEHESAAMWKIYASPGAGVAIVSNGASLERALADSSEALYLGRVKYREPSWITIGIEYGFDNIMTKRSSFSYEQEVRLVHRKSDDCHNAIDYESWSDETMRFERLIEDERPILPGISVTCDLAALFDKVIVSPYAPSWFLPMIERLRDQLGLRFAVQNSTLLDLPTAL